MNARTRFALLAAILGLAAATAAPAQAAAVDGVDGLTILTSGESLERKMPKQGKAHNFRHDTSTVYWSVVASFTPTFMDLDLDLYDDKARTQKLATSALGVSTTDFVAVDGNHRAPGDYFASVRTTTGKGANYYVEYEEGTRSLSSTPIEMYMASDDIVTVLDTYLVAGTTYTFTLDPSTSSMDGDLFLLGSDPANPSTWVRTRGQALRAGAAQGLGGTETFTFTPVTSDYYGLVVLNEAIGGTYALSRTS